MNKSFQDFINAQVIRVRGIQNCLILAVLWADSADDKMTIIFFLLFPENRIYYFVQIVSLVSQKIEFDISYQLSPKKKNCIKPILFKGKNKKTISKCHSAEIFYPAGSMLSDKQVLVSEL